MILSLMPEAKHNRRGPPAALPSGSTLEAMARIALRLRQKKTRRGPPSYRTAISHEDLMDSIINDNFVSDGSF
jgi:hypothetical protein